MPAPLPEPDTRTRIVDAAERLLARYGYQKMTMDDLAAEARLGRRTLYLHFRSKEEIVIATIDRLIDLLVAELRRVAAGEGSPADRLYRMLVLRILFLYDRSQARFHTLDEMYAA